jgi:hypothetical protein
VFLEVNGDDTKAFCSGEKDTIECFAEEKNRMFVMELLLHCSDISNPYKPFSICAKWADLVVEEFCAQGDREKKESLEVSPMCDRDTIVLYNMQMGFIDFVVTPLIVGTLLFVYVCCIWFIIYMYLQILRIFHTPRDSLFYLCSFFFQRS